MMTFKEIQELIRIINRSNIREFKLKQGDFSLTIRGEHGEHILLPTIPTTQATATHAPAVSYAPPASPAPAPKPEIAETPRDEKPAAVSNTPAGLLEVKSPIVGTFYRSPSPDKPPYIKIGDTIAQGQVVCIVEAMKLFNEIESEVSGKVVKILVEDASPVEYDQPLFLVDPKG